jgi:branched-chain amino acid transport system substrate-binding protein
MISTRRGAMRTRAHAKVSRVVLLLVAALVLVATACGGDDDEAATATTEETGASQPSGRAIKIGFLAGVTGDYAPWTGPAIKAVQIAQKEVNDAGGVLGRPIRLVITDNKSTVEGAVSGFRKLVDVDQIVALSGLESDAAVALLDATAERTTPSMCPQCGTNELDKKGGVYIWRLVISDTDIGVMTAQLARDRGYKKMAILAQKTEGSLSTAETFKDAWLNGVGAELAGEVQYDPNKQTFQTEVQQAFSKDPDAVYLSSGFETGIPVLREWDRRGYGKIVFLSPDMLAPEVAKLGEPVEEGKAVGVTPVFDEEGEAYKSFTERYEASTGNAPTPALWEAGQYDGIILLALAIEAAGKTDGETVKSKITEVANAPGEECTSFESCRALLKEGNDVNYQGASTPIEFNEYGNLATAPMGESHAEGGNWVQVKVHDLDAELKEKVLEGG